MDGCFPCTNLNSSLLPSVGLRRPIASALRRPLTAVAIASGTSRCQFGGLSAPLQPRTPVGRHLSGVLLDDRNGFMVAARKELERLVDERDEAAARLRISLNSDEACLHRRIAELKEHEHRYAVEDVMYMLILHEFFKMGVPLIPGLSKCVYNGRLEIWPSKDWELESVHSSEVLQMVREHLTVVVGCRANSNVTDSWATTTIQRLRLCKLYKASILHGYFLKSASLRHRLESCIELSNSYVGIGGQLVSDMYTVGSEYFNADQESSTRFPHMSQISPILSRKQENLWLYATRFEPRIIEMCSKPKSKEALDLIERHNRALFGDEVTGLLNVEDVLMTSFACLKRFLLEAVAFGSFLWDIEHCVNAVYTLEEHQG